nr:glycosyltransferase [Methyloceanibacter methanicus]
MNCKTVADEYAGYPAAYQKRVYRIDHGFDPKQSRATKTEAREAFGLPTDVTLLGSVARLSPKKGHDRAIKLLPGTDWHLAIVGQGAEHDTLAALGKSLGVSDRLHFLGEVPPEGVAKFLRALDVFVFPTTMETFGLAAPKPRRQAFPSSRATFRFCAKFWPRTERLRPFSWIPRTRLHSPTRCRRCSMTLACEAKSVPAAAHSRSATAWTGWSISMLY